MGKIDWAALRAQVEEETIMEKSALIQDNPDGYECSACCIEGQPCDVGLAVKVERQRIIKLLEDEPSEKWFFVGFRQHIIALINGEK